MPKLIFIDSTGVEREVDAAIGQNVMRVAVDAMVAGIEAICGGNCICATCHGYVDERWLPLLPPPDETEAAMIEYTSDPQPSSRLTCQIQVTAELDGLVIRLPTSQH